MFLIFFKLVPTGDKNPLHGRIASYFYLDRKEKRTLSRSAQDMPVRSTFFLQDNLDYLAS